MGTKVKYTTKKDKTPEILSEVKKLNGRKIRVGAMQGSHAWLASIHEYGCNIPVTDKMRAFLHSQGLHLKDSTTVIKIPERAFLRNGHDENAPRIIKQTEKAISLVIAGKMSSDELVDMCGEQFATAIKNYLRDVSTPKNHPFTISRKGSGNPLISTGGLLESITWKEE